MELELTPELAIKNLDKGNSFDEKDFISYECKKGEQQGIFVISNYRIAFAYVKNGNIIYENMFFDFVNRIKFNISEDNDYIEIIYEGEKNKYTVPYRNTMWELKNLLSKYIQNKTDVLHIKASVQQEKKEIKKEKSFFDLIQDDLLSGLFKKNKKQQSNSTIKSGLNAALLKSSVFFFILVILSILGAYFLGDIKTEKLLHLKSRLLNPIAIARCEQDMTAIILKLNIAAKSNGEYPNDISLFLRKNIKNAKADKRDQDVWGSSYIFTQDSEKCKLISAGPNKIPNDYDDLVQEFEKIKPEPEDPSDEVNL